MHIEEPQFHHLVSTAKSRIHLWERVLRVINVKTMLEVGVWKGEWTLRQILAQCEFTSAILHDRSLGESSRLE